MSPGPIDFLQIEAWSRLRQERIKNWELSALRAMDQARLDYYHSKLDEDKDPIDGKRESKPVKSSRPLSPELFDSLFGGLKK